MVYFFENMEKEKEKNSNIQEINKKELKEEFDKIKDENKKIELENDNKKKELLTKYYEIDNQIEELMDKRNELKSELFEFKIYFKTCGKCYQDFKVARDERYLSYCDRCRRRRRSRSRE